MSRVTWCEQSLVYRTREEKTVWLDALCKAIDELYKRRSSFKVEKGCSISKDMQKPPQYIKMDGIHKCMDCGAGFGFMNRKHHCRACGLVSSCVTNSSNVVRYIYSCGQQQCMVTVVGFDCLVISTQAGLCTGSNIVVKFVSLSHTHTHFTYAHMMSLFSKTYDQFCHNLVSRRRFFLASLTSSGWCQVLFTMAQQSPWTKASSLSRIHDHTQLDTPPSVGLLWMSD